MKYYNPIEQAVTELKSEFKRSDFTVYVFGPSLRDGEIVEKPHRNTKNTIKIAKFLRYQTIVKLEALGYKCHKGESKDVYSHYTDVFNIMDFGHIESVHAQVICNAIIIFPSSAGSFCELGLLSALDGVPAKTIAIVEQQFAKDSSFIMKGMMPLFRAAKGVVEDKFGYSDYDACIESAIRFVNESFSYHQSQHLTRKRKEFLR